MVEYDAGRFDQRSLSTAEYKVRSNREQLALKEKG